MVADVAVYAQVPQLPAEEAGSFSGKSLQPRSCLRRPIELSVMPGVVTLARCGTLGSDYTIQKEN